VDQYLAPGVVCGVLALVVVVLRAAVDVRTLRAVPAGKEAITREEYDRDEKARKEQHVELTVKCRDNARGRLQDRRRNDEKFDVLVQGLADLRVQLARLATCMERGEDGGQSSTIPKEK
jgi:hypothetical protein